MSNTEMTVFACIFRKAINYSFILFKSDTAMYYSNRTTFMWLMTSQLACILNTLYVFQHPMKPAMIPRPGMMQKPHQMGYHHPPPGGASSSATSQPGSLTGPRSGAWQSTLRGAEGGHPHLVIPRAKVKPKYQGYTSDDDRLSAEVIISFQTCLRKKNYDEQHFCTKRPFSY